MKPDDTSLARLMALAQAGDRDAYTALLNAAQAWLRRYFARRVNPAQLDDLVQETLISLHRKRASFDASRPFLPWLAAIARYRWVDHLRLLYKAELVGTPEEIEGFDEEPAITARISLERLLTHLSSAQVEAIELVKIEGLSVSEASQMTGQSESLIKVNIHRGLKRLTSIIEKA
jgi:RNA polymerase sigma factor (sigma-70 family)